MTAITETLCDSLGERYARLDGRTPSTMNALALCRHIDAVRSRSTGEPAAKIAFFATCYVNYHQPEIGADTLEVMAHNNVDVSFAYERCCGMPHLSTAILRISRSQRRTSSTCERKMPHSLPIVLTVPKPRSTVDFSVGVASRCGACSMPIAS